MIRVDSSGNNGSVFFTCDECGIVQELDYRMMVAHECGEDIQYDHCACEKVGDEFFMMGYCDDAFCRVEAVKRNGMRKTGRAYRRAMAKKKKVRHPNRMWEAKKYYKKYSNRIIRRKKLPIGNEKGAYRKAFDLWWTIY